ncbi:LysR family transcriptional regulator [Chelativorans sp. ZYF759]|uniref:LysR family transcriptional regulator n=1 Tax=Chelativorans sp. ZYF759 TaxID=2692213 RepID=UPI00145D3FF1|nr:LysR family transcriptional regulator [Chelativorans sp. ZYF759]NMG41601.1 LysR family transcriptional regulator [Chelativorans sp. ZYF759]
MKNVDWDDLRLFLAVARHGGLTGAAREQASSAATVGRRMLALERAIGRPLFMRRQTGYELTDDGRNLLARAQAMELGARTIADWLEAEGQRSVVRISAGTWTANFLAANFARLWRPDDPFRIAFKTTEARLDIAHREVEIGVRNAQPDSPNLAARRTVEVAHAPFRARSLVPARRDEWVAISPEDATTRSARWLSGRSDVVMAAWANTPRTLHDLIRAGVGKGVLPCFAGDRDADLERAGAEIAELREWQWLVMHNDDRHRPDVRTVIDRMVALVTAHAALFGGERPVGEG